MKQISKDDASNNPAALVGVGPLGPEGDHQPPEVRAAKELARRYRLPFVELLPTEGESPVDYTLFNEIPVDLMVRHQFLPLKKDARGLHLAMADPTIQP